MKSHIPKNHRSILNTLAFFDISQYPLTITELYKYLDTKEGEILNYHQVHDIVHEQLGNYVRLHHGHVVLGNHTHFITERQRRFLIAEKKYKKALSITKLLVRFVPGIKGVCVCNTLALNNAKEHSDIDLFVIAKSEKLYQTRMLSVLLLKLLGKRPGKGKRKDTVCLSFFVSEEQLNLKDIAEENDVYLHHWISQSYPIYNKDEVYERFCEENAWVKERMPNIVPIIPSNRRSIKPYTSIMAKLVGILFPEKWCRSLQERYLPDYLKKQIGEGKNVIMSDTMIKLHANDRRHWYRSEFYKRIKQLNRRYAQCNTTMD